jgi:hypothetical protein
VPLDLFYLWKIDIAPSEKVGITVVTPESDVASKVIYDYTPEQPIFEGTYIPQPFCEILDSSDFAVMWKRAKSALNNKALYNLVKNATLIILCMSFLSVHCRLWVIG